MVTARAGPASGPAHKVRARVAKRKEVFTFDLGQGSRVLDEADESVRITGFGVTAPDGRTMAADGLGQEMVGTAGYDADEIRQYIFDEALGSYTDYPALLAQVPAAPFFVGDDHPGPQMSEADYHALMTAPDFDEAAQYDKETAWETAYDDWEGKFYGEAQVANLDFGKFPSFPVKCDEEGLDYGWDHEFGVRFTCDLVFNGATVVSGIKGNTTLDFYLPDNSTVSAWMADAVSDGGDLEKHRGHPVRARVVKGGRRGGSKVRKASYYGRLSVLPFADLAREVGEFADDAYNPIGRVCNDEDLPAGVTAQAQKVSNLLFNLMSVADTLAEMLNPDN